MRRIHLLFTILVCACTFAQAQDQPKPETLDLRVRICGYAADGSKQWHPPKLDRAEEWMRHFFEDAVSDDRTRIELTVTYDCDPFFETAYNADDLAIDLMEKTPDEAKKKGSKQEVTFTKDSFCQAVRFDRIASINRKKGFGWPMGDFLGAVMSQIVVNRAVPYSLGTWDPTDVEYIMKGTIPRFREYERHQIITWLRVQSGIRHQVMARHAKR